MENNHEVLLKVDHLCQYFRLGRKDLKAVDDVSFEIRKGETFGLVGESGCGKTTTGRSIIKLYNITSGNVYFKGQRIGAGTRAYKDAITNARADAAKKIKLLRAEKDADDARKAEIKEEIKKINEELAETVAKNQALLRDAKSDSKLVDKQYVESLVKSLDEEYAKKFSAAEGDDELLKKLKKEYTNRIRVAKKSKLITQIQMIFQDPIASLDPRMTVRDIIAEGLVINGITDKEYINEKVYEILEMVGLVREHADRYPHEFSGGQRQRIGIARAVIMQPEMIIADEPISALDVSIQAQVINLLNDLRERLGLTIMFIAHDLSVVKYFSDRIGVMYFGKMVELADSDELFKNPLHPYTKSLLSAIPLPDPVYEKQRTRIHYNPIAEHDYSVDTPSFREITPGHFVYCNDAEEKKYKEAVK
ncbi:MAG: ATP-binding cassette domain-containing protein [Ruminococcaceae bacterium]|nr:ATP-binding cassette domain-containing protein [Oscillospiraceae bacterium]